MTSDPTEATNPEPAPEFAEPSFADFKYSGDGSFEVKMAYILGTLGLLICPAGMVATALASMAIQKGHPKGAHAMFYSVLMLTVAIGGAIYLTVRGGMSRS